MPDQPLSTETGDMLCALVGGGRVFIMMIQGQAGAVSGGTKSFLDRRTGSGDRYGGTFKAEAQSVVVASATTQGLSLPNKPQAPKRQDSEQRSVASV